MSSPADNGDGILRNPPCPRLAPSSPSFTLGAQTCLLSSHLAALMITIFPLLTSPPSSFSFFHQALGLFPQSLGSASEGLCYSHISFDTFKTWGATPFIFSSPLSPASSILSPSASRPRLSSFFFSPHELSARAFCDSLLLHIRQIAQRAVPCLFLADIVCHYVFL